MFQIDEVLVAVKYNWFLANIIMPIIPSKLNIMLYELWSNENILCTIYTMLIFNIYFNIYNQ